jgi:hypothetical protein
LKGLEIRMTEIKYVVYEYGEGERFKSTKRSEAVKVGKKLKKEGLPVVVEKWKLYDNFKPFAEVMGITFGSNNKSWFMVEEDCLDKELHKEERKRESTK